MKRKLILGEGWALDQACAAARDGGLEFLRIELETADRYNFDLQPLFEQHAIAESQVFIAMDERAVNFTRHQLIAAVRLAGYELLNIVSPRAIVHPDVKMMGNVYIGPGCNVAARCNLGIGSWLSLQVLIGEGSRLGACATLLDGVLLGADSEIGLGSTLGPGSVTMAGTKIGRRCEWLLPGPLPAVLPSMSFHDPLMPDGARIL